MKKKVMKLTNTAACSAILITLFALNAAAQYPSPTPAPSPQLTYGQARIQELRSEQSALARANNMTCPLGSVIVRIDNSTYEAGIKPYYQCVRAATGSFPKCDTPPDKKVDICIYNPVPVDTSAGKALSTAETVDYVLNRLETEFPDHRENAEVFIPFGGHEKSLAKYLRNYFKKLEKTPPGLPAAGEGEASLGRGLIAYTTPDAAKNWSHQNTTKIIPLTLQGDLKIVSLSALLYLRDEAMALWVNAKVSHEPSEVEKQKHLLMKEITAKLKATALLDDAYYPITGDNAEQLGCRTYGATRINILDPTVVKLADAEVALGHQPQGEVQKAAAAHLSYWYQVAGIAPYAKPSLLTDPIEDEATRFIKNRLVSCEKLPGLDNLPDLERAAPNFLKQVLQTNLRTTPREFHAFHWFRSSLVTKYPNATPGATDPVVVGYLESHWKKFYRETNHGDMVGSGLYLSTDPFATREYGGIAVDMTIPKGTRFFSFLNTTYFDDAAQTELRNLRCTKASRLDLLFGSVSAECLAVARSLVRVTGAAFNIYHYTSGTLPKSCGGMPAPGWALAVYDPALLNPSRVTLFNRNDTENVERLSTEQKMLYEYFKWASAAMGSRNAGAPAPTLVSQEDFSKWLNASILGCGASQDWQKDWQ